MIWSLRLFYQSLDAMFVRFILKECFQRHANFTLRNRFPICRANPYLHLIFRKHISNHMKINNASSYRRSAYLRKLCNTPFFICKTFSEHWLEFCKGCVQIWLSRGFRKEKILIFTFCFSDDEKKYGFSFLICLNTCSPYGNVKPLTKILQVCNFICWSWPEPFIWLVKNCDHLLFDR